MALGTNSVLIQLGGDILMEYYQIPFYLVANNSIWNCLMSPFISDVVNFKSNVF